jgi:hypothetical protein
VRVAGFGLQPDLDGKCLEIVRRHPAPAASSRIRSNVLFIDVEIHPDRIERHDGGELRRRRGADEFADGARCALTTPSNGRGHIGITVIDRCDLGIDLGLKQVRLRVIARGVEVSSVACETACAGPIPAGA